MQKEVYADNVDMNGEVHETLGENIRNGAKSAESIAKALQSDEITFDMQAIMNVLPFMDSTKKIIKRNITVNSEGMLVSDDNVVGDKQRWWYNKKVYGLLFGDTNRGNASYAQVTISLLSAINNLGFGISTSSPFNGGETCNFVFIFMCEQR